MGDVNWQELNDLFAAALELEPAARGEFLRRLDDERLRSEVEAMIAAAGRAEAEGFLDADAFGAGARILADDAVEGQTEGRRVGNYRFVREIGRGGMGAVFLAEREDFRQRVALKVIKRGMDTEAVVRRFRRERQVLASLDHPNIARLLDGGTTPEGTPFFVMEYVEGLPVTDYCDRHKLTIEDRLRLFRKVCAAVDYAHRNLVVHRDIKPSNILATKDGEPKLLDFGIAKLLASDTSETTVEQTGDLRMMTPDYASPEQIRGGQVTAASDVYSLGVLLYELLCGHHPFGLKNVSPVEALKIVSEQEPTTPSTAAMTTADDARDETANEALTPETVAGLRRERPEKLRRRLRGDLDNITLKALRKEPGRRYESAAQLSEDVGRHLAGLPVKARPASVNYRAAKFLRRNRATATLAAMLAILLVAVGASWAYFLRRSQAEGEARDASAARPAPRTIAVLPFVVEGEQDESLGADLTETLISRLGRLQELEVRPASAVASYAGRDAASAGRELRVEAVLESRAVREGGRVRVESRLLKSDGGQVLWSGAFDESLADVSQAQDAIAERAAGTLLGQLTVEQRKRVKKRYTDNPDAYKLYLQGKHLVNLQNEKSLNQSVQYFNRAIELDPGYALAYAGIADAYLGLVGVYLGSHEALPKAKAAAIKALELDPELAEAHTTLAMVLAAYEWDWAAADAEFERALDLNPNYASARHWYARHLALTGRRGESKAQFDRARELDPLSPYITLDSCFPDFFDGNYDRAIEQINRAIEINDNFWFAYWVRGWAHQQKGDTAAAIADYERAQAIENSTTIQSFIAHAYAVTGRSVEARLILDGLLKLGGKQYVGPPFIASVYAGLGDREQALAWLERGLEERHEWMIWLKYDQRFGELRKDPRVQALLRRVGLPG